MDKGLVKKLERIWIVLWLPFIYGAVYYLYTQHLTETDSEETEEADILFGSNFTATLTFLLFFAFGLGMNLWVTFIAGIVMFKTLPRHMFGNVQSRLFPCFFAASGLAFTGQVFSFSTIGNCSLIPPGSTDCCLVTSLYIGFFFAFLNGWHIGPKSSEIMFKKHVFEKEEGEVPPNINKLKDNKEYMALSKKFGMYHGMSMLSNLVCLAAQLYTLYYIANTIME